MLPNNTPYLIAETAFHHQGDTSFLKTLIDTAHIAKADAVKFHLLLNLDNYFVKNHDAYNALSEWVIPQNQWKDIIQHTLNKEMDVIALCNDPESIDFILNYDNSEIKAIEIHATGLNDYFLLEKASKFKGTVILGVGGSTLDEINFAVELLNQLGQNDIFLMYGFQNYPTRYQDINLSKMIKLRDLFQLPVGYADHTDPLNPNNEYISTIGIAMGVNVCEKHFTHVFGEKRIDSQAAISLDQLIKTKELMNILNTSVGNGALKMSDGELSYGNTGPMKKAIVAKHPIKKGDIISLESVTFKRTNEGSYMSQNFLPKIIGLQANTDINTDQFIDFSNLCYEFKKADSSQFNANK